MDCLSASVGIGEPMSGLDNGTESGPFQNEPHRQHPTYGRITVMGRTANQVNEWTVKDASNVYRSVPEAVLLDCPPAP